MANVEDLKLKTDDGSHQCCYENNGNCTLSLPQPKRPTHPVPYGRHELLECFPCYYEPTWPLEKFPFLKWLLKYKLKWLFSDLLAGLTVGLMVVPQALAYANIANLPAGVSLEGSATILMFVCKSVQLYNFAVLSSPTPFRNATGLKFLLFQYPFVQ